MHVLMGVPQKGLPGGTQSHLPLLVSGLSEAGVQVDTLVYGRRSVDQGWGRTVMLTHRTAREIQHQLRSASPQILHINTALDVKSLLRDVYTLWFARKLHARCFLKTHGTLASLLNSPNPLWRFLVHRLFSLSHGIGVLSSEEVENFRRAGYPEARLFQVKNIVDPEQYALNVDLRAEGDLPRDIPLILFAARLVREKGLADVLAACQKLKTMGRAFHLVVLGDGPHGHTARIRAQQLGLMDHVRFMGHIPEEQTRPYYAGCDLLVHPTYYAEEGFPMAVFHAVAAGLPVITTAIRGSRDHLLPGTHALFVPPRNPNALAHAMRELLDDGDRREAMSRANRSLAQHFTKEPIAREFIAIYQTLLQSPESP